MKMSEVATLATLGNLHNLHNLHKLKMAARVLSGVLRYGKSISDVVW